MNKNLKKTFKKDKVIRAFILYIFLFLLCALFFVYIFYKNDKLFIWEKDGLEQHLITLITYRNMIIDFFKAGNFNIFTWNIGLGMDLFSNFAYYIFGDFVSYFSILFAGKKMHLFYCAAVIIRIFLAGITFIIYSKYKNVSNHSSVISAIAYSFCTFSLYCSVRHPYIINGMILFPLLMMGIEKAVNEDKRIFYILIIFLSFLSSFYLSYMMALCIFVYGSILIISKYREYGLKVVLMAYLKIFLYSLIGILLASFILVPTLNQFLSSTRNISTVNYEYNDYYYAQLLMSLVSSSNTNWVVLGYNAIILFTLPLAIKNYKNYSKYLLFLVILILPLVFIRIGSIFCGFSFPNNRWSFVFPFIFSFITANVLDKEIDNVKRSDIKFILGFNILYFLIISIFIYEIPKLVILSLIILIVEMFIILNKKYFDNLQMNNKYLKNINLFKLCLTILIVIVTFINLHFVYVHDDYIKEFITIGEVNQEYQTSRKNLPHFKESIDYIKDYDKDNFYRIGKSTNLFYNSGLYYDYNSYAHFYSITPKLIGEMAYDLANIDYITNIEIGEFNQRTKILTLLNNKYFITDHNYYIPHNYKKIKEIGHTKIYENERYVPFISFYDKYIDLAKYDKLSSLEKESSLLKSVALGKEDIDNNYIEKDQKIDEYLDNNIENIDYDISKDTKKIKVINAKDGTLTIDLDKEDNKDKNGELYLKINNFKYNAFTRDELYDLKVKTELMSPTEFKNKYPYEQKNNFIITVKYKDLKYSKRYIDERFSAYSYGNSDLLINLDDYDSIDGEIKINLQSIGHYTYDSIELFVVNFNDYKNDVENLRRSNFDLVDYANGSMKAKVNLEKNGLLQFATTYSDGWDVYIDGKKNDALRVNKYFLGVYAKKGSHTIELKYHTPYLKLGIIMSIVGLISFCVIIFLDVRKSGSKNEKR